MCTNKSLAIAFLLVWQIGAIYMSPATDQEDATESPNNQTTQPEELDPELASKLRLVPLTDSINDFGMQLMKQLNDESPDQTKNIAFSPLSIGQIFSMLVSAAQNATQKELMTAFGFEERLPSPDAVNSAFKLLLADYDKAKLEQSKRPVKLSLPSMALYSTEFNIKKSFRKNLKDNYHTDARKIDFSNGEALNVINSFVSENTNGLIPKLLEKLDPETKLALVNAFYFKGAWTKQFDQNLVKERPFNNADKTTTNAKLMFKRDHYLYFDDSDVQAISVPYLGNASMTILMPQKGKPINDLIKNLNSSLVDYYRYQMKMHQVELFLPKFKIENSIDLKEPMNKLGVREVFSDKANLAGITSFKNVYVSQAVHKAFLDVNEQGTEAAASTSIGITTKSFSPNMKRMLIDRPFVYLIHDQLNNLVLFMGAVKKL